MKKASMISRYVCLLAVSFLVKASSLSAQEITTTRQEQSSTLQQLLDGNGRFKSNTLQHPHESHNRLLEVVQSQHPSAIVISCSDSRVPPELVFDQGLGDLFVVRTAGNTLSEVELGSVEYAVEHLHTHLIIVLGHENCGAIKAVEENAKAEGNLKVLLNHIRQESEIRHVASNTPDHTNALVQANISHVVHQLQTQTGILGKEAQSGQLQVVGAEYFLHDGTVKVLPSAEYSCAAYHLRFICP